MWHSTPKTTVKNSQLSLVKGGGGHLHPNAGKTPKKKKKQK
jgi:hypothetical protein